jgi:hypothetical protein
MRSSDKRVESYSKHTRLRLQVPATGCDNDDDLTAGRQDSRRDVGFEGVCLFRPGTELKRADEGFDFGNAGCV